MSCDEGPKTSDEDGSNSSNYKNFNCSDSISWIKISNELGKARRKVRPSRSVS